jgi:menaquinone-dependent protoporphyrinogen oxidase
MENKILVVYATSYGSTREIAGVIAETLQNQGITVDVEPIRNVRKPDGYRAVVLGAPLYMFHWHNDALHFLSQNQKAITGGLPMAVFAGGSLESDDEKERQVVQAQLEKELAKYPWFKPVSVLIVGGKFDPTKLRFPYNLIPAMRQMPAKDLRDWEAIKAWAGRLAELLQPVTL